VAGIAFKLPSGDRLQRRFRAEETVGRLYDYIDGFGGIDAARYELCMSFPRKVLEDRGATIEESGLLPQAMLMVAVDEDD